ncbi:MAG TPA: solute carrier family 23 protein [Usitatibacter sp.]|nr:solute carrier family 23 protein [Usitatibacter sp.]
MRKPANLAYGVAETPPPLVMVLNGIQHVALISAYLVYPLLVFRSAQLPTDLIANLLSVGFFVLGIGTLLQATHRGPVGSGFLCPTTFTATFIGPALSAIKLGGLPLLFGMTLFSGLLQSALSRGLLALRPFLPTELSGFVVLMVGVTAGVAGVRYMLGAPGAPPVSGAEWLVASGTLLIMAGLSVWSTGLLKMVCALVGLAAGYAASAALGLMGASASASLAAAPIVSLPSVAHVEWAFDLALVVPFTIAAFATTLKAMGTVTLCQRMNDADWVRPDMASNRRGVLADGIAITLAGAAGTFGVNSSSASVALISATGVASRSVAYVMGALFIALGVLPKLATLLALMPRPVMAAALIFATCFLLVNGMQIITSRMLDTRKTLVIGLAMVAGLAVEVFPGIVASAPKGVAPLMSSSLVFGTLVALVLNLIFRIGVRQAVRISVDPSGAWPKQVDDFFRRQGGAWGARPDVVSRAAFATLQCVEAVAENCSPRGPIGVEAAFDEFNLSVQVDYEGEPLEFPDARPSAQEIRVAPDGMRRLAGFMLRRNADRMEVREAGGRVSVHFHFIH